MTRIEEAEPDALVRPEGKTRMEAVLTARAKRLNLRLDQLREHDHKVLRESQYPTPTCLDPSEVDRFFTGDLTDDRASHIETCAMCAAMIEVADPPVRWFDDVFGHAIKDAASEPKQPPPRPQHPVMTATRYTAPILVFLLMMLVGLAFTSKSDVILFGLLRDKMPAVAAIVLGIVACTLLLTWLLATGLPSTRAWSGLVMGGICSLVVGIVLAQSIFHLVEGYDGITSAQYHLLATIAENPTKRGFIERVAFDKQQKSGTLVATTDNGYYKIYWELPAGTRRYLAKVYEGKLQYQSNGDRKVLTSSRELPASLPPPDNKIENLQNVMALVPEKTSNAARIFPIESAARY
ncbi:hypothetical protein QCM77_04515 [Bradyrhizobium sp. SSUT18]|uniref:hypothetical protein n=1 Tax=Bradyrhizobium sp. SSUT18 TaxID=3040602 RepID=UPI00244C31B4|nr:hypothetical protein [Bradyrhizobium sp. SSUT18]MDH2399214.1 hypothetical protein [Bradyrhizobium sp. SSUT18]